MFKALHLINIGFILLVLFASFPEKCMMHFSETVPMQFGFRYHACAKMSKMRYIMST